MAALNEVFALCIAREGSDVCGDAWSTRADAKGLSIMVVDGLGHGQGAAEGAQLATACFRDARDPANLSATLQAVHHAMRASRGGVVGIAYVDRSAKKVQYAGIGNISCRVFSGLTERSLPPTPGIVGAELQLPAFPVHSAAFDGSDVLLMATDGIAPSFFPSPLLLARSTESLGTACFQAHRKTNDDATIVVTRAQEIVR